MPGHRPKSVRGDAQVCAHDDHAVPMSFLVLGMAVKNRRFSLVIAEPVVPRDANRRLVGDI